MYQIFVRIIGRYAPIITFPVAVVLGVIGYNLESILVKASILSDGRKDVDAERGITEKREERLLHTDDQEEEAAKIYTQRNNMFDKNDAKHLKK